MPMPRQIASYLDTRSGGVTTQARMQTNGNSNSKEVKVEVRKLEATE